MTLLLSRHRRWCFPRTEHSGSAPIQRGSRVPEAASRRQACPIPERLCGSRPATPEQNRRVTFGFRQADRKSTRLNSSHLVISYAVFCLKKKTVQQAAASQAAQVAPPAALAAAAAPPTTPAGESRSALAAAIQGAVPSDAILLDAVTTSSALALPVSDPNRICEGAACDGPVRAALIGTIIIIFKLP